MAVISRVMVRGMCTSCVCFDKRRVRAILSPRPRELITRLGFNLSAHRLPMKTDYASLDLTCVLTFLVVGSS